MKKLFLAIIFITFFITNAVAATITSNGTGGGSASAGATWVGGVVPADDDAVTVAAGDSILWDLDTSGYAAGLQTVTITGIASGTPGMIYFKDGTSGFIKLKTGYSIVGTNTAVKGRLLANSDGVWGNTGALAFAYKAIIATAAGTSTVATINQQYLDIALYCTVPTNSFLRTYYDKYSISSINTGTNVITMGSAHGWSANRAVSVRSSGTLPAPLQADIIYYVGSPSGADLKLLDASGGAEIDLTGSGTGTIEIYSGYETYAGVTTVNVLEDASADTPWLTYGDGTSNAVLSDVGEEDWQRIYLTDVSAGTVTLSAALDSAQAPGSRIFLVERNISLRSASTGSSQAIISSGGGNTFQCSFIKNGGASVYGYVFYSSNNNILIGCTMSGSISTFFSINNNTLISCVISGHTYVFNVSNNNILTSCVISGHTYVFYSSNNNTLTGCVISGNTYVLNSSNNNILTSCTVSGNAYHFRGVALNNLFRNCLSMTGLNLYSLNANYTPGRIKVENLNRVDGVFVIFDNFGNLYKRACDGTGDTPSIDPVGGNGYCLSAESIQSNCNMINPLTIMEEQRIWLSAAEHTITYKLQTTYAGITAGNLKLTVQYVGTDGTIVTTTNAPAITQRSDDADWTQTLSVTITPSVAGWVRCKIDLMEYESGNEVYVWPIPIISGVTPTLKWADGNPIIYGEVSAGGGVSVYGF